MDDSISICGLNINGLDVKVLCQMEYIAMVLARFVPAEAYARGVFDRPRPSKGQVAAVKGAFEKLSSLNRRLREADKATCDTWQVWFKAQRAEFDKHPPETYHLSPSDFQGAAENVKNGNMLLMDYPTEFEPWEGQGE